MIYGYLIILGLYLVLFLLSGKEDVTICQEKKSYPGEGFFLKAAAWCFRQKDSVLRQYGGKRLRYDRQLFDRRIGEDLKLLYPALPEKQQVRSFYIRRYSLVLAVLFFGVLLSCFISLDAQMSKSLREGDHIERKGYEGGDLDVRLSAQVEGEEERQIFYSVGEQKYTEEEIYLLYQEAGARLPEMIIGGNASLDAVTEDLSLVTVMEGYPFQISWESDSYPLVHTDGTVLNEDLEDAEIVMLTARLRYDGTEFTEVFPVQIQPAVYTEEELLLKKIQASLEEQDAATSTEPAMQLPSRIGKRNIIWKEVVSDSSGAFFLIICLTAALVFGAGGREVENKLQKRSRELLLDYPEIVNKLMLYLGAGMTIRNAFLKMGEDYKKQRNSDRKRYVYEEIVLLCHELQSGISEAEAYAHLGKRCRLQSYMKLSTLLSQNLRKGSNDLLIMMRQEAAHSFEQRKNTAKKLGEEAGTKLLLPMMMMLCIVMVLIMIPAYFSFA